VTPSDGPTRHTVGAGEAGVPVGELAAQLLGDPARAALVLAHGGLWLGRERVLDAARPAPEGELLTISQPPDGRYAQVALAPEQVLYEDADLIVIDKPAGAYVEATPWDVGGHLLAAVAHLLAQREGAAPPLHLAHRLDRDTSGALVFSKNPEVNPRLQATFAQGEAHKQYLCRCQGAPAQDTYELATGHGRGAKGRFRVYPAEDVGRALPQGGGTVKVMRTRLEVLRREGETALVRALPATGRTHQIRLHMAHAGHPLLGDAKYGGPPAWRGQPLPYHLLHAELLRMPHPRTGQPLEIAAAPVWWG